MVGTSECPFVVFPASLVHGHLSCSTRHPRRHVRLVLFGVFAFSPELLDGFQLQDGQLITRPPEFPLDANEPIDGDAQDLDAKNRKDNGVLDEIFIVDCAIHADGAEHVDAPCEGVVQMVPVIVEVVEPETEPARITVSSCSELVECTKEPSHVV